MNDLRHLFKVNAVLSAHSSSREHEEVSLRRIFRESRRGLRRFVVYVELSDLERGKPLTVSVEIRNATEELVWEPVEDSVLMRQNRSEWVFWMDGPPLIRGGYAISLIVNGRLTDLRLIDIE
ncbi:MAG: hypothetical protein IT462_15360 [Planctomycetes bacterium]|nr:hypothetical protein [Planctomycetota bacterium]